MIVSMDKLLQRETFQTWERVLIKKRLQYEREHPISRSLIAM